MNEERARELLSDCDGLDDDGGLFDLGGYVCWEPYERTVCLDGDFTTEYLQAIIWWMENKAKAVK